VASKKDNRKGKGGFRRGRRGIKKFGSKGKTIQKKSEPWFSFFSFAVSFVSFAVKRYGYQPPLIELSELPWKSIWP